MCSAEFMPFKKRCEPEGAISRASGWPRGRKASVSQVKALAAERGTPIEIVADPRLTEAAGTTAHQGIVAFVASPPLLTLDELTSRLVSQSPIPHIVILDGVKDPRNLGAIIRSAAAFGIGGVIVPGRRAVGITATVAKAAAGGLEHVAWSRSPISHKALND